MKNSKDFPYKTSFSAEIKCLVSPDTDKFLSLASLDNLKFLIPQPFIDKQGIDLLPIAFNGAVVNRCNVNGDSIDTATALDIYQNFIHRPVDVEHKPLEICGHIINAGFTQFGTDKELTSEQVKDLNDPFNLALAAYIYARNYDSLAESLEEAADPDNLTYKTISASWELLFKSYKIMKGTRNLSEATVVEDPNEIKKLEPMLQVNKGTGRDKKGNYIYRLISGEVYASGIGLTKRPAAQVKGIFIPGITDKEEKTVSEATANKENQKNSEEIISNSSNINVLNNEYMKKLSTVEDIKNLKDEELKECKASDITQIILDESAKAAKQIIDERKAKEAAETKASENALEIEKLKSDLQSFKDSQATKDAEVSFNNRMTSLDELYKLDAPHRKIIAKQIRGLDEDSFTSWATDFDVMNADKKKSKSEVVDDAADAAKKKKDEDEAKAAKDKKDKEDKDKMDADEKAKKDKETKASTAREMLDNIKTTQASIIPNTSSTNSESLVDKYRGVFGKDSILVKPRR